eukprot:51777-Rhodomonas_salina.5
MAISAAYLPAVGRSHSVEPRFKTEFVAAQPFDRIGSRSLRRKGEGVLQAWGESRAESSRHSYPLDPPQNRKRNPLLPPVNADGDERTRFLHKLQQVRRAKGQQRTANQSSSLTH